ncbi:MAG: glycosyl hydrolase [Sphingomonadales bacterium]|nr:glycosyl hydrolase [Sphingomonadales bacterium]
MLKPFFRPVLTMAILLCVVTLSQAQQNKVELNSSYFQSMSARNLGPSSMSGRITSIEGTTVDNQINLFVGTAGGGIWKSLNGGITFTPVFDKYCQSIGALAIDPTSAKTIYAATGESNMRNSVSIGDGMYKTTDAGANWQKIGLDSTEHISKIWIDPKNTKRLLVAAPGPLWSSSTHRGLYATTDAGKTWEKILYVDENTGCADLAVSPRDPNILLASFWQFRRQPFSFYSGGKGSGLFRSTDGGKTWLKVTTGLPEGEMGRIVIRINPSKPQEVLAIVEASVPGLYISQDEGLSWKKMASTDNITARPFYFSTLEFDPKDPKRVYRPAFDFQYSTDGGYSWSGQLFSDIVPHADHHALWINPENTNTLYLGTDGGVYVSHNKGLSWAFLNNLPVGQFYHVSVSNDKPFNVYGGLQDNGSWMAPSSSPGGVASTDWQFLNGGDGFWVEPSPINSNIVYAESQGGEINRVNLKTGLSYGIKPQRNPGEELHRWNWNTPIVTAKSNKRPGGYNLYTANQFLYKSVDEGTNWIKISPDLTTNDKAKQKTEKSGGVTGDNTSAENHCTIFTLAQDPRNEDIIWVGTDDGNLQYTNNGGKNWTNLSARIWETGVPKAAWISCIEISAVNPNQVFVTLENHMYGDHKPYLVVSNDAGKTFKRLQSAEWTGFAHVIRQDPQNADLLFLGTEMGLFISLDGGANWMRSKYQNLPWYALVRDLRIANSGDLAIGTHGRGIYVLDNLSSLRALAKSDLSQELIFYPVNPFVYDVSAQTPSGYGNLEGWTAGNKANLPAFEYYLKERSSQAVKIIIYDNKGNKIKDLNGGTAKGLNKVFWGLDQNPCKVATGGFTAGSLVLFASVIGPRAPIGTYKAVITIGDKKYEQSFQLLENPSKGFTKARLDLLFAQTMRLFKVQEDLYYLVDSLNKRLASLKKIDARNAAQERQYQQLDSLRKEIIETNRKTVFFDEFKYRRRLADVYIALCTSLEPFSASKTGAIEVLEQEFAQIKREFERLL